MSAGIRLLLTFVPVLGLAATYGAAWVFPGRPRFYALWLGPILTWLLTTSVISETPKDGNLLAVLLYGGLWLWIPAHYAVLVCGAVLALWRRKRTNE